MVGEEFGIWVYVYSWEDGKELDVYKGYYGFIWFIVFFLDGNLYVIGFEDGIIKMWKNCEGFYGFWRGGVLGSSVD